MQPHDGPAQWRQARLLAVPGLPIDMVLYDVQFLRQLEHQRDQSALELHDEHLEEVDRAAASGALLHGRFHAIDTSQRMQARGDDHPVADGKMKPADRLRHRIECPLEIDQSAVHDVVRHRDRGLRVVTRQGGDCLLREISDALDQRRCACVAEREVQPDPVFACLKALDGQIGGYAPAPAFSRYEPVGPDEARYIG